jgi:EAL domain-containing protein (putative c-di-GMP-specific phosphodiesterase class I)
MPARPPVASPTIARLLADCGGISSVYQPIVDLTTGRAIAYEALARFGDGRSPAVVFDHARRLGAGVEAEAVAIDSALRSGPPPLGARLSVNLSPSGLVAEAAVGRLPADLSRFVVEITENELVANDELVGGRLADLRARGALIAVDDAGAGYASLRQVMQLRPDIIKLDRSLISGVHEDPAKRALIRAFVTFARDLGSRVCGEGIEHVDELRALADLDVATGQGYVLGRPAPPWPTVESHGVAVCAASLRDALRGTDALPEDDAEVTLETVARRLAACRTYEQLDECVMVVQQLLDVPEITISRVVGGPGATGIVACAGSRWAQEPVYALHDFPATADALATGDALQVLASDGTADPVERRLMAEHGYGALLLVPLVLHAAPVGLLEVFSREERPWSRRQIAQARAVGHQVALLLPHLVATASARAA